MSKVKIQGNASGTGVLTVEAPNTNTDRTITLPDSTGTLVDDTTAVTKDANGNVGIGVTPESDWGGRNALQLGEQATWGALSHISTFGHNCQTRTGGVDYYMGATANEASQIQQYNGAFAFKVAPTGTANTAISWKTPLTIQNDQIMVTENDTTSLYPVFYFKNPNGIVGSLQTSASSTNYNTSSDYRLKENVVPMTGSIDRLKALKPSRFNFIADADKTVDGFLAHEAGEVVPECATGEKDAMRTEEYEVTPAVMDGETEVTPAVMGEREVEDYQGIDQSKLVPLLVASLQEAVAKIEALETRVTQLENA